MKIELNMPEKQVLIYLHLISQESVNALNLISIQEKGLTKILFPVCNTSVFLPDQNVITLYQSNQQYQEYIDNDSGDKPRELRAYYYTRYRAYAFYSEHECEYSGLIFNVTDENKEKIEVDESERLIFTPSLLVKLNIISKTEMEFLTLQMQTEELAELDDKVNFLKSKIASIEKLILEINKEKEDKTINAVKNNENIQPTPQPNHFGASLLFPGSEVVTKINRENLVDKIQKVKPHGGCESSQQSKFQSLIERDACFNKETMENVFEAFIRVNRECEKLAENHFATVTDVNNEGIDGAAHNTPKTKDKSE